MNKAQRLISKCEDNKKLLLTPEEEVKLWAAMSRTWQYIGSDAEQAGVKTASDAAEMVLDADRVLTIGKLDKSIYQKVMDADIAEVDKFVIKNKNKWY